MKAKCRHWKREYVTLGNAERCPWMEMISKEKTSQKTENGKEGKGREAEAGIDLCVATLIHQLFPSHNMCT